MHQLQADAPSRTSPSGRSWLSAIGLVAGLFLLNQAFVHGVGGYGLSEYYLRVLTLVGISIILAVSLTLVNGCAGQFSIGHAGFMAIGAYAAGAVTHFGGGRSWPCWRGCRGGRFTRYGCWCP